MVLEQLLRPSRLPGRHAIGLDAESIGGGGGNGSLTISAALAGVNPKQLALAVGGNGGAAGNGGDVTLMNTAAVQTGSTPQSCGGSELPGHHRLQHRRHWW